MKPTDNNCIYHTNTTTYTQANLQALMNKQMNTPNKHTRNNKHALNRKPQLHDPQTHFLINNNNKDNYIHTTGIHIQHSTTPAAATLTMNANTVCNCRNTSTASYSTKEMQTRD